MHIVEIDCAGCGLPNTVSVGGGRRHRCALCGDELPIRQPADELVGNADPWSPAEVGAFDGFFESFARDCTLRAERMFESMRGSLPTGVTRGARSMGRWMARRVLRELDDPALPPGIDHRAYRREELAVHVAGASVAVGWMDDPNGRASVTRRSLLGAIARRRGPGGRDDVDRAVLRYADAIDAHDLSALGWIGGERVSHGVLGEGLVVAGSSLAFIAAWNLVVWEYVAPTCTIR